jgi:hypothetical protein
MRIAKGQSVGKLKAPFYELMEAAVCLGGNRYLMCMVNGNEIERLLLRDQITGMPRLVAMERGQYVFTVYPRCDRRYDFELIGTVIHREGPRQKA